MTDQPDLFAEIDPPREAPMMVWQEDIGETAVYTCELCQVGIAVLAFPGVRASFECPFCREGIRRGRRPEDGIVEGYE